MPDNLMTRRRVLREGTYYSGATFLTRNESAVVAGPGGENPLSAGQSNSSGHPMFGVDARHSGYNPDEIGPKTNITEQWTAEIAPPVKSPAVVGGTIYVGSGDGTVFALNADDGNQQWQFEMEQNTYSSPTVVDDTVYVSNGGGGLYAIETDDGSVRWHKSDAAGWYTTPVVTDRTVYVGSERGMHALDPSDGSKQWQFGMEGLPKYSERGQVGSLSLPAVANGTVVAKTSRTLYAINAMDGTKQWENELGYSDQSKPTIDSGTIYIQLGRFVYAIDLATGNQQWRFKARDRVHSSPAVANGTIYFGTDDSFVYAVDAVDGTEEWVYRTEWEVQSSPVVVDETVYIGSRDKHVYAFDATDGTKRWQYRTDGAVDSSPAVVRGALYIGSEDETLYALTEPDATPPDALTEPDATPPGGNQSGPPDARSEQDTDTLIGSAAILLTFLAGLGLWRRGRGNSGSENPTAEPPASIPSVPACSLTYDDITKQDIIGSGGNADIYAATARLSTGEASIAVKEPRIDGTVDTARVKRLLKEAETWTKLDTHDHIVDVIDFGRSPYPWIAMEYMDGGDISERAGELPLPQSLWTAEAITRGVLHAHRQGVAHLDLKPANILFRSVEDAWDVPKVADWGLAKRLLDHSNTVEGLSPTYAAPEQFDTDYGPTDERTDIYQLAAVFYELFTGRPPFEGEKTAVMHEILTESPTPPTHINTDLPKELDEVLLTALAKQRADRYESVLYFRDALHRLRSG
jgi:outer membrane protein assembly factor BamB/tRNA A-37 threonylcarbamoyl transferase component Bud32